MIPPNAYNPSLIRFQNRLLLSYRCHDRNDWRTSLHVSELDTNLRPISSKPFLPPKEHENNSIEDARLFVHQNKLWISFTISQWPATVFRAIVGLGELLETDTHWQVAKCYIPTFGRNDFTALEKNWVFFSREEKLWCIYGVNGNEQTILRLECDKVAEVVKSKALAWPYAAIHGGAICDGENGNRLHFFNSHTEHKDRSLDRYLVGAAELSGVPPFDMVRISSRPLLAGEEGACLDKNPRYKANVCFACGAIKEGNDYLVAFGWNDCQCRIVRLRKGDLKL